MRGRSDMDINVFKIRRRASHVAFYILAIALFIVFLSPFIVMVTTSFKTLDDAFTVPVKILPREWTFSNYGDAVERIPYWRYMGNTAYITLLSLMGELIVVPLVAYSLAKIRWRGAGIVSGLLMATMMIPYTVTMIPLYRTWHAFGLTGTYVPLIAPHFVGHAYYIIIMRQFMKGIPNSLFEAAKIDGCKRFGLIRFITFPCILPIIAVMLIMQISNIMNAGFDSVYNLYNETVYDVADIIDTLVYRLGVTDGKYEQSTAVGLFKNVINFILLLTGNWLTKKMCGYSMYSLD